MDTSYPNQIIKIFNNRMIKKLSNYQNLNKKSDEIAATVEVFFVSRFQYVK